MSRIFLTTGLLLLSTLMLVACAAPTATEPATGNLAGSTPPPPPAPPAPPHVPPMSSPTPPQRVQDAVVVVTTCKNNADCAVKNVGNCCGAMPACVNKDSPTDPAAVQAQCNAKGMVGVCGFQEVTACQCRSGQCVSAGPANPTPSSDPGDPVR